MEKAPLFKKWLVWVWVALCLGFAAGHLLSRADQAQQRAVVEKMRREFDALKTETQQLESTQREVASLKRELASARKALAAALAEQAPTAASTEEAPAEGDSVDPKKAFTDMVLRIGHTQLKTQIEGRLGVLKDRLQLTAEQEAAVKKILDDESTEATGALDRLMAGQGTPSDFARFARLQRGQLPAGVDAVLTDAQRPEYAAFQEQERVSSVENRVNMELSGLVSSGGLTPEQKDQVFSTLSGLVMSEDATDFDSMQDVSEVRTYMDEATRRRLEAMQPILSEPQWQMYESHVNMGRQVLSSLMPTNPQ
ncbi:MAG: hypothetical protein ACKV19_19520 [Verrucomicrobiales bacterium]